MVKSEADVIAVLDLLTTVISWNPLAKFAIFVDWLERDWQAYTHFILKQFFPHMVEDLLIIMPTDDNGGEVKVRFSPKSVTLPKHMYEFSADHILAV